MDDKFNLDDILSPGSDEYGTAEKGEFSLDDILKDFGTKKNQESLSFDFMTESVPEPEKKISFKTLELDLDKNKSDEVQIAASEIDDTISKPSGISYTGTFEQIRREKSDNVAPAVERPSTVTAVSEPEPKPVSNEITDEITDKRFFDTETFNSIKDKSRAEFKNPISAFVRGSDEQDDGEESYYPPIEATEEIDDYEKAEDREDILIDLKKLCSSAFFKMLITFVLTCISGVFFAVKYLNLPLPGADPTSNYKLYLAIIFSISTIATIVNVNSFVKGITSLVRLNCCSETFLSLIFIASSAHDIVYLVSGSTPQNGYLVFDFIYMILLLLNITSKHLLAKNICKNFTVSASDGRKSVINKPVSETIANDIMIETGTAGEIAYASKSNFVTDFIGRSFSDFEMCDKSSVFYTVFVFVIIALAVVQLFLTKSVVSALTYVAGALCVFLPFLQSVSFALPLVLNSSKARRSGGVIIGCESANMLDDVQTLIIDDSDAFVVSLNGIRLYGDALIDDAILYLNSLYGTVGGPLNRLFKDMLSDKITSLPRIDEIYYHDTMGYSGLIHSKVFVAGNKQLMEHFGIEVDDSEYEIVYQQKARRVLFVAYDGKLMGVFLLSYALLANAAPAFAISEKNQVNIAVAERDANVTTSLLLDNYKAKDASLFKVMNFRTARSCFNKLDMSEKSRSLLVSHNGLHGLAAALHGCKSIVFALKANKVVNRISSVMALVLISFLLFFSEPSGLLPLQILVYQLLWCVPSLFVSFFSK